MARPTFDPEGKRKQVAVRFGPQELSRLEELAKEASEAGGDKEVSVGKLVETRIAAMLSADAKTFELLANICARIGEAQEVAKKAHPSSARPDELLWHQDLYGWAAVAELLARGPIEDARPEYVVTDEGYQAAQRIKLEIVKEKKDVMERLAQHGVSASLEPSREFTKRPGLFGGILQRYDRRGPERAMIDAIPDEDSRNAAIALHAELIKLDDAEASESDEVADIVMVFRDMENEGRRLFRDHETSRRFAKLTDGIVEYARRVRSIAKAE